MILSKYNRKRRKKKYEITREFFYLYFLNKHVNFQDYPRDRRKYIKKNSKTSKKKKKNAENSYHKIKRGFKETRTHCQETKQPHKMCKEEGNKPV